MSDDTYLPRYRPRFRPQLGRGTPVPGATRGSKDCNLRAFQHALGKLTRDTAVPWVRHIRQAMGRPGPTGTNLWDTRKAARELDGWMEQRGRKPVRAYLKFTRKAARQAVRKLRPLVMAVDYGEWNDLMGRTGDPNYRGGHAIFVLGQKRWADGTIVWCVWDSLEDNRRNAIPQGPKWRPRWKVLKAARVWADKTAPGAQLVACVVRGGGKR